MVQERSRTIVGAHADGDATASVVLIVIDVCTILDVCGDLIPVQSNPGQVPCSTGDLLILAPTLLSSALTSLAQRVHSAVRQEKGFGDVISCLCVAEDGQDPT